MCINEDNRTFWVVRKYPNSKFQEPEFLGNVKSILILDNDSQETQNLRQHQHSLLVPIKLR